MSGLRVDPAALESGAQFQSGQGERLAAVAGTVRSATATGNVFGLIGELTGLADSYRAWQDGEVTALGTAGELTGDLSRGLRRTADTYRQADQDTDTRIKDLDAQVGAAVAAPGSAGPR